MWEISNSHQLFSFFVSFLFGIGYAVFYTVFKAVRRSFHHSDFSVFLEDIIFFEVISFITFLLLLALTNGEIRFFVLLSIFLGFAAFYFTLAKPLSKIIAAFLCIVKKLIKKVMNILSLIFGVFFKTIHSIYTYCSKKLRICHKYLKKLLKARGKMVYTKKNKQKV